MSWIREQKLMRLVHVLWNELAPNTQSVLIPYIEDEGMAWAVPLDEYMSSEDLFTPQELSKHLGVSESTVRSWPKRYGLKPNVVGQYRWGDVQEALAEKNRRNIRRNIA